MSSCQPLYLLADSQLLFWKQHGRPLLQSALDGLDTHAAPSAAYVGASNGDRPEYYEIFEAAMDVVGITDRRMIASSFGPADRDFLTHAEVIVLAGGDVRLGWTTFEKTGMKGVILDRYTGGAILVGISAGAVQLGRYGFVESLDRSGTEVFEVFNLVPAIIDTHDEQTNWARLTRTVESMRGAAAGFGIPSGSGLVVHADAAIEPLRRPAHQFRFDGDTVTHSLLRAE
ncbi:Type 1 glutamine amidotransferase-like domain-containing protein [Mycobacterium sherrisii]|uniref:Peptidase n=1 Tax=Mycobacterium sherrisii TaxID=243061 RepID=A0A1E3SY87_9MYCO|nr:Type 1 glutamine amidotransferase-like domain-containing protein [Mycobacterium sherrisii]MCV7029962.1 Type 1 glutamine amidotransferase-like domain-containing protein [Mycobacterium sherrisii]MEC4763440.1 Type 1 glutamine amidotransferase-like domain-containing protein [Mycobacterium sherrisii]ODR07102.1 peptidase [Mycobacterium sherrisii]ORW74882.1 peptidase [Mycobacterium sherrisii]